MTLEIDKKCKKEKKFGPLSPLLYSVSNCVEVVICRETRVHKPTKKVIFCKTLKVLEMMNMKAKGT